MPDITSNLDGWWRFNEGSGTTAADSSGNGKDATLSSAGWSTGYEGSALNCNLTRDATVPDDALHRPTSAITFGLRLYYTTLTNSPTDYYMVLSKQGGGELGYGIYIGADGDDIRTFIRIGGEWVDIGVDPPSLNAWHSFWVTFDGSTVRFYIDGVEATTGSRSGSIDQSTQDLTIGSGEGTDYFSGLIDDVRIYSRALSAEDIEMLHEWTGSTTIDGTASFTEPNETLSSTATHPVTGSATPTEPNETLSSSATHPVLGTASFTEPNETLSSDATVANPAIDASAAFTEPNETLSSTGTSTVTGVAAFTEPNESLSADATHPVTGSAEFTEPNETLSAAASSALLASADFTEPNETLSAAADHPVLGVGLQTAEPNETLEGAAGVVVIGNASFTEGTETLASLAGVTVDGVVNVTEPNENLNSLVDTGVGFVRRVGGRISMGIRVGL